MTSCTANMNSSYEKSTQLMSAILEPANMQRAYARVLRNKGAPGCDGMTVEMLKSHLMATWAVTREQLLEGRYYPKPVRKVEIPKPGGGTRMLGIPTVEDRLIQQAVHQVLNDIFEPKFSVHSYGFRPGRSAGQAVRQARGYVEAGHRWVVDLDLEKFFDRVNHDVLMARLARHIGDKVLLRLLRRYLEAGILVGGTATARTAGTPQGGPLSPLLSNVLLDDFDRELEGRGHRFCRYADDCNVYVKSQRAGERVLESITVYLEKRLKLRVNRDKSGVDRPWRRTFLGYSVNAQKRNVKLRIAKQPIARFKLSLKQVFRWGKGRSIRQTIATLNPKIRGWVNYFRYSGMKGIFIELDSWIRRHLRNIIWRQWKRVWTRAKGLMRFGIDEKRAWQSATNGRGPWWNAGASHMNQALPKKFFSWLGLISLMELYHGRMG